MGTKLLIAVLAVVLFLGAAWVGALYYEISAPDVQLTQPGWCCIEASQSCVAVGSSEECRSSGGTTFNWDANVCNSFCAP